MGTKILVILFWMSVITAVLVLSASAAGVDRWWEDAFVVLFQVFLGCILTTIGTGSYLLGRAVRNACINRKNRKRPAWMDRFVSAGSTAI